MNDSNAIRASWEANAENWILTVQNKELESRRLATNKAIVDALLDCRPQTVLDLGCGEGWLCRTLRKNGVTAYGCDAVKRLVDEAIKQDGAFYWHLAYEEIIAQAHTLPVPFDAIVINFALFDKEITAGLMAILPSLLAEDGLVFIQTLHPSQVPDPEQKSGWQAETWSGMKRSYVQPYNWYYRDLFDWAKLWKKTGLWLQELRETVHPHTGVHLSVIFILTKTKPNDYNELSWQTISR